MDLKFKLSVRQHELRGRRDIEKIHESLFQISVEIARYCKLNIIRFLQLANFEEKTKKLCNHFKILSIKQLYYN